MTFLLVLLLAGCQPTSILTAKPDTGAACPDVDGDGACGGADCDDADRSVHPGAAEVCDGLDDDCDGLVDDLDPGVVGGTTWYADTDADGTGDVGNATVACVQPAGFVADATDCDDANPAVHPGAAEVCDGLDDDCDGLVDDLDPGVVGGTTWYADADADGTGDVGNATVACVQPAGFVADATDCDDADRSVHPGAAEVCDGLDDDCDGLVDDLDPGVVGGTTWYADTDADGTGDASNATVACVQPAGFVADATDCDDADPAVHPGAAEVCDGLDDDCDGLVDDLDPGVVGGTTWYADADADGTGDVGNATVACVQPAGFVADATDCDDADRSVHPGAAEVCDGLDDDCDGLVDDLDPGVVGGTTWYADTDADGTGDVGNATVACVQPAGFVADATDCDDTNPAVHLCHTSEDDGTICADLFGVDDGRVPDFGPTCDTFAGFTEYGGHCYYPVKDMDSWEDARASCAAAGGYLATITSADEADFVVGLAGNVMVGGCDADAEGTWSWVNGEEWTFAPWGGGEPDNNGDIEDCAEMYTAGSWNDIGCTWNPWGQEYVCEADPASFPEDAGGEDTGAEVSACPTFDTTPARWSLDVDPWSTVRVTLDATVDPASIGDGSLVVRGDISGRIPGTVSLDGTDLVFTPAAAARPGERLTAVLTAQVACTSGAPVRPRAWMWTAAVSAGTGSFTPTASVATGNYSYSVGAWDFDGDGDLELAVAANHADEIDILDGPPDAYVVSQVIATAGLGPISLAGGDIDGDGDIDLAIATMYGPELLTNEAGVLSSTTLLDGYYQTGNIRMGDLDADGDLDLVISGNDVDGFPRLLTWFANDGAGTFTEAQRISVTTDGLEGPAGLDVADIDGDDDLDVVVAAWYRGYAMLYRNDGTGSLDGPQNRFIGYNPKTVYANDFDGDGDADLALPLQDGDSVDILENSGSGLYAVTDTPTFATAHSVCGGDLDGDGDIDLVVPTFDGGSVEALTNDGLGAFTTTVAATTGQGEAGVFCADVNGDGAMDVVSVAAPGVSTVTILLNTP